MKTSKLVFLIIVSLICCACRTGKSIVSSSEHIQTDSILDFSRISTTNASVLNVHDSVRIIDSVRVVVDTTGNVLREYHSRVEKNTIVERGRDTIIIVMKDSAVNKQVDSNRHKETKVVVEKDRRGLIMFWVLLACIVLYWVAKDIRRRNG